MPLPRPLLRTLCLVLVCVLAAFGYTVLQGDPALRHSGVTALVPMVLTAALALRAAMRRPTR